MPLGLQRSTCPEIAVERIAGPVDHLRKKEIDNETIM
jgi:hypothetical protein